jgi:hypothetical protein
MIKIVSHEKMGVFHIVEWWDGKHKAITPISNESLVKFLSNANRPATDISKIKKTIKDYIKSLS